MLTIIQAGISCKWIGDSQRFLLEHLNTIHGSPSHIYHSALPFCPSSAWLHKAYTAELSQEVKVVKGLSAGWGSCSQTVTLDSDPLALSYWNNIIAAGSRGGDIIILNAITGSQTAVLSGHTDWVRSVAFSSDGKSLVSGSDDQTVKLWDIQTGGVVKTFCSSIDYFLSVSISADCTKIASGSDEKNIHLWDIQTGQCHWTIKQQYRVEHVRFSPTDPQHIISISGDEVWQWDVNGHQIPPTYNGSHIAFSPDHAQFALCNGKVITVQNSDSRAILAEFTVSTKTKHCCFSPDGQLIAAAAGATAYIWDITSPDPHLVETFIGHTKDITSLAFSSPSSLVLASKDKSVRFWQIGTPGPAMVDLDPTSPTSAAIKSITLQPKDGISITSDSDGVVRTWDLSTGLCKASLQTPAKGFHRGDVQLISGRLIFVWYADRKISTWDVEKGELLWAVDGPNRLDDLRISGDGSRVFCLSERFIQVLSVQTGEVVDEIKVVYSPYYMKSLTVNGSRVWLCDPNSEYLGWNFGTLGSSPFQLHSAPMLPLNDTLVWDARQSKIRDTATGKVVFQLSNSFGQPTYFQWNYHYLAACFNSIEVLILDFNHVLFQ